MSLDLGNGDAGSSPLGRQERQKDKKMRSSRVRPACYNLLVADLGKLLVFFGGVLVIAGVALIFLGRTHLPIGRLPGDILYRGKHTTFYFPLMTSILLSVILSLVLYIVNRMHR